MTDIIANVVEGLSAIANEHDEVVNGHAVAVEGEDFGGTGSVTLGIVWVDLSNDVISKYIFTQSGVPLMTTPFLVKLWKLSNGHV